MKYNISLVTTFFLLSLLCAGCSGGGTNPAVDKIPTEAENTEFLDSVPVIGFDGQTAVTMLGAFNLTISPSKPDAELTPMRSSTLGEAYILSGAPFFTNANCFRIKSIAFDPSGGIAIEFQIKHPFKRGNPSQPPSSTNRLDLDLFDVAMVVKPVGAVPSDFLLTKAHSTQVLNADGYTTELMNVVGSDAALPYKICYASSNNNRFSMGTDWQTFKVIFSLSNLQFDIFITMGYGASARKLTRLTPTYYIPEFNRKAAWKVRVYPPTWDEGSEAEYECVIDIYDWNHGATVASDYPDPAHTDWISASSDVVSVEIEIPAILNSIQSASTKDTSQNGWDNPLTYIASLSNEKMASVGEYVGLVKVSDSRVPNASTVGTDYLIHTPDGILLQNYLIPEFATYQAFKARVVTVGPGYDWGKDVGSSGEDIGFSLTVDSQDNIYITGCFEGTVDFNPDPVGYKWVASKGLGDAYLLKIDKYGDFKWVNTWGAGLWDEGHALAVDDTGNIYVTGFFQGTVDFNPSPTSADNRTSAGGGDVFLCKYSPLGVYQWVRTWGGDSQSIWDEGHGLVIENPQEIYVTGQFRGTIDFNPGTGVDLRPGFMEGDAFISKFDGSGNYLWAQTWGGYIWDEGHGLALDNNGDVYITGCYGWGDCDFDPGPGYAWGEWLGGEDVYLLKLDNDGNFVWVKNWGSTSGNDKGMDVTCVYGYRPAVTGYFSGTVDFDPGTGSDSRTSNGSTDIFVTRLSSTGSYDFGCVWGGSGEDRAYSIVYEAKNNELLIVGSFEDLVDFDFGGQQNLHQSNGGKDIFLSCMNSYGSFKWAYTWGGLGIWDEGHDLGTGSYYVTGKFSNTVDMNPRNDGEDWHTSNSGSSDIFLVQFDHLCEYNEIEPNDICVDATGIDPNTLYCGTVRKGVDDNDYFFGMFAYCFEPTPSCPVEIFLYNDSGENIDLYLYNDDCSSQLASSTNPGDADEYILYEGFTSNGGMPFTIKVENKSSDNYGTLKYRIKANFDQWVP